jgi:hypothetical protein
VIENEGAHLQEIDGKGVANLHRVQRVRKWMKRRRIVVVGWKRGPSCQPLKVSSSSGRGWEVFSTWG